MQGDPIEMTMLDAVTDNMKKRILEVLKLPNPSTNVQLAHREGRIRELVYLYTGKDLGYDFMGDTTVIFKALNWKHELKRDGLLWWDETIEHEEKEE